MRPYLNSRYLEIQIYRRNLFKIIYLFSVCVCVWVHMWHGTFVAGREKCLCQQSISGPMYLYTFNPLNLKKFCVCLCVFVWKYACVCRCSQKPKDRNGAPGTRVMGGWELPEVAAGNQTRVLCKSNAFS